MLATATAVAIAIATGVVSTPAVGPTPPAHSEHEVAYVAAKLAEGQFARSAAICPERRYRKALAAERAAFEQAHPEYRVALAAEVRPDVAEVAASNLAQQAAIEARMQQMLLAMPALRQEACDKVGQGPAPDFAQKLASARGMLARAAAAPPPEAWVALDPAQVGPIVAAVLQHADVAMYLHPEVPGRVPVRIALAEPHASAPVALELYGEPVETTDADDAAAVQLGLKAYADRVDVDLRYRPEGISGTVRVESRDGTWVVTDASILE